MLLLRKPWLARCLCRFLPYVVIWAVIFVFLYVAKGWGLFQLKNSDLTAPHRDI